MTPVDKAERELMERVISATHPITDGRPIMFIVGFDAPGGVKICSISNVSQENQLEMMELLIEGLGPTPQNVTLN